MTACLGRAGPARASNIVDFEDLPLAPESFYNGADGAGGFSSRGAFFNNSFTDFGDFSVWSGWAYSNVTDNGTPGFGNQYSAIPGSGTGGSPNYAVAFAPTSGDAYIELPQATWPQSIMVTNSTYAYYSMLNGDAFARRFGGESGDEPDFFLLTISGLDGAGEALGTAEVYLADYRFADNRLDYLLDEWTHVDLSSLAGATTLSFGLESSDVGPFGINTPTYFAVDNLRVVPEPATCVLLLAGLAGLWRRDAHRGKTIA